MKENLRRLQEKRAVRSARESSFGEPRVRVAVQHVSEGKSIPYFPKEAMVASVYDWVASYTLEPENFRLCLYPGRMQLAGLNVQWMSIVLCCTWKLKR